MLGGIEQRHQIGVGVVPPRLQGGQAVGIDTDGDGKADRNLTADERASQVELNHAAVKAYCSQHLPLVGDGGENGGGT